MNCREFADFLNLYFEEELSPDERAIFDQHLALCETCRAYLDGYLKTVHAVRASTNEPDRIERVPNELIAAILAARPR